jgi:hypothetical protein
LQKKDFAKGEHSLIWNGKDINGTVVPDEAYNIVVTAATATKNEILDFRMSGGEVLKGLQTKVDKRGNISYKLPKPARVLVRAGIENGPMLRMISNWEPKNRGKVRQRWNMKDADGLMDISSQHFGVAVSAFSLPDHAIIATNNKEIDYYQYFKKNGFSCNIPAKEKQIRKKEDVAISKHFYMCRIKDRDPRLFLSLPNAPKDDQNISLVKNGVPTLVKVSMHAEDEEELERSKYEVSFFVDFKFSSEEELGYMPISWNFNPNALKRGKHILTVNVSSFSGQVGLRSYQFMVE